MHGALEKWAEQGLKGTVRRHLLASLEAVPLGCWPFPPVIPVASSIRITLTPPPEARLSSPHVGLLKWHWVPRSCRLWKSTTYPAQTHLGNAMWYAPFEFLLAQETVLHWFICWVHSESIHWQLCAWHAKYWVPVRCWVAVPALRRLPEQWEIQACGWWPLSRHTLLRSYYLSNSRLSGLCGLYHLTPQQPRK